MYINNSLEVRYQIFYRSKWIRRFPTNSISSPQPSERRFFCSPPSYSPPTLPPIFDSYPLLLSSPRNHLLFTPLLSSTAVGTLEFRSIAEPLKYQHPFVLYHRSKLVGINPSTQRIEIQSVSLDDPAPSPSYPSSPNTVSNPFSSSLSPSVSDSVTQLSYDFLIIGVGARVNTFNIPGVKEYTHFLKELSDARGIRKRLLTLLENCSDPSVTPDVRKNTLLHIVIVGGGPTGIEFAAELHDFINEDITRLYPNTEQGFCITIVEGKEILGGFDGSLREYTMQRFASYRQRIRILTGAHVIRVDEQSIHLSNGNKLPYGLCVWSTGIAPNVEWNSILAGRKEEAGNQRENSTDFRSFATDTWGHLIVDNYLRVLGNYGGVMGGTESSLAPSSSPAPVPRIYAMGDAAAVRPHPYAATAQVAEQQGRYLADIFNDAGKSAVASSNEPIDHIRLIHRYLSRVDNDERTVPSSSSTASLRGVPPFRYRHRGSLAFVGSFAAISDFTNPTTILPFRGNKLRGFTSFLLWRSAYLTKLGSWRNRMNVPFDWFRTFIFGRDTTLF